ncbi:MAG: ABC transporter permease [Bacteroidia bacterium]|nr:ABC transporter permease [Bacteroidia bacterium]
MRTILFILYKEFRQIFRNKAILPIIFIAPILQLVLLAYAANFEVKNLKLVVVDRDQSSLSRRLMGKFEGSAYFKMAGSSFSQQEVSRMMEEDQADLIIEIPVGFERRLFRENTAPIQLVANAIDGIKGGLAVSYSGQVIRDFNREMLELYGAKLLTGPPPSPVSFSVNESYWFNPKMDYKTFMVPGILALLVTMIGSFLSSMNIVREKEMGTIEQINVTPIRKYQFIIGKLLPFLVIALFEFGIGLIVARLLYNIPFLGSIPLMFGFTTLYMIVILGLGLFISTFTETQQQAMFIAWFFMVIFIFLSGMFTAIENMPSWAQKITYFNPVRYFIEVIRMVMLKGAGLKDITRQIAILAGYAVLINGLAVWNYRKTA